MYKKKCANKKHTENAHAQTKKRLLFGTILRVFVQQVEKFSVEKQIFRYNVQIFQDEPTISSEAIKQW